MIKTLIYPFIATKVAVELAAAEARNEVQKALQYVLIDTLSDTREINDLKAEIAVLRSEVNELRYERASDSGRPKVLAR